MNRKQIRGYIKATGGGLIVIGLLTLVVFIWFPNKFWTNVILSECVLILLIYILDKSSKKVKTKSTGSSSEEDANALETGV